MRRLMREKFSWEETVDRETVTEERRAQTPNDGRCGAADREREERNDDGGREQETFYLALLK
jgi:hypothetical protein